MSERVNGRNSGIHFQRKAYIPERPGILTSPSEDLIKRRTQAHQDRDKRLSTILAAEAQKALAITPEEPETLSTLVAPEVVARALDLVLPIEAHKEEIIDTVRAHKASIVISDMGSGKSTQVPQYLMEAGMKHIFVMQGRRGMVDGLADRIQDELNHKLGADTAEGLVELIHGGRTVRYENSAITVLTAATLTHMMPSIIEQYADEEIAIIGDELHEDDPHVELGVGVVGLEVSRHDNWHFVGMSGTIDPEPLKVPFGRMTNFEHPEEVDVPVIQVEGRLFPRETHEAPDLTPAEAFVEFGTDHRRSILGERGFEQLKRMRETIVEAYEAREQGSASRLIFREYSSKTSSYQRTEIARLSQELPDDMQLVVLATPAARSGITIPGTTFVAIGGHINREIRNEDRSRGIVPDYMSQSEVMQFLSRGGRDVPGGVGYLCKPTATRRSTDAREEFAKVYPFKSLAERPIYPVPGIFNSNLSELVLNAAHAGADPDIVNKFLMNEQDESVHEGAVRRLRQEFGALDNDRRVTEIGQLMSRYPIAPELARGLAEAQINGRSRQHLARMAVIATAIDTGGFQVLKAADSAEWKAFLRSGADDDFIAQLDFYFAMRDEGFDGFATRDGATYSYLHDLDYSRMLSAQEPRGKIMRRMGINPDNFEIEPPVYSEIQELRDDFTAGMYGLTYKEFQRKGDAAHHFKSVRNPDRFAERTLAKQSVLIPGRGELVAGMPQFYMTINKGAEVQVDILGATLKVSPEVVGRYALAGRLVDYVDVPGTSRMNGGMVTESEQAMFGVLKVGAHKSVKRNAEIPAESQRRLVETIQNKPGYELQILRDLAKDLAEFRRLMPARLLAKYRRPDAPSDLTNTIIEQKLKGYAERTRSAQEIDELIGQYTEREGLTIELFYQSNAREEIHARSPETIIIAGEPLQIFYDNGKPYATRLSAAQLAAIDGPIFIDEGFEDRREVLHQVKKETGRGTRRISFGTQE